MAELAYLDSAFDNAAFISEKFWQFRDFNYNNLIICKS